MLLKGLLITDKVKNNDMKKYSFIVVRNDWVSNFGWQKTKTPKTKQNKNKDSCFYL